MRYNAYAYAYDLRKENSVLCEKYRDYGVVDIPSSSVVKSSGAVPSHVSYNDMKKTMTAIATRNGLVSEQCCSRSICK